MPTLLTPVIAHRGAQIVCPENTIAAFREAIKLGADSIEFDVHASNDGHLVVHHDVDLSRTTSGSGLIHRRSLEYLRGLDAGSWFDERFSGERIPMLSEVLALEGVRFELELKGIPSQEFVSALARAVADADAVGRTEFTGHSHVALLGLRERLPAARLGLFPRPRQPWMSSSLFGDVTLATALTGRFAVVHLWLHEREGIDIEQFQAAGVSVHLQATPDSSRDELVQAFLVADQVGVDDVEVALRLRSELSEGRQFPP